MLLHYWNLCPIMAKHRAPTDPVNLTHKYCARGTSKNDMRFICVQLLCAIDIAFLALRHPLVRCSVESRPALFLYFIFFFQSEPLIFHAGFILTSPERSDFLYNYFFVFSFIMVFVQFFQRHEKQQRKKWFRTRFSLHKIAHFQYLIYTLNLFAIYNYFEPAWRWVVYSGMRLLHNVHVKSEKPLHKCSHGGEWYVKTLGAILVRNWAVYYYEYSFVHSLVSKSLSRRSMGAHMKQEWTAHDRFNWHECFLNVYEYVFQTDVEWKKCDHFNLIEIS